MRSDRRRSWFGRVIALLLMMGLAGAAAFGWLIVYVAYMEDTVQAVTLDAIAEAAALPASASDAVTEYKVRHSYDCILVLGAQVKPGGEPSEVLRRRVWLAAEFYHMNNVPVITTGGQGADEPMAEGESMAELMTHTLDVPLDMVVVENDSYNTRQNIANAKGIMDERGLSRPLVITSDYHLPRALAICAEQGIDAIGAGSESAPEMWWKNHTREALAWVKYRMGL